MFFKKNILMNQKSRQLFKNNIEKDFYEWLNNSNFCYNCWSNLEFVPIFDEFKEINYIGRYFNFFDQSCQDIKEKYNDKLIKLDKEDKFYAIELNSLNAEGLSSLKAAENVDKRKKKTKEI